MKTSNIIIAILLCIAVNGYTQRNVAVGGGFISSSFQSAGILAEAEFEKIHSGQFSIPVQVRMGYYPDREGNDLFFAELSRGYRMSFQNGLFLEQSFGAGVMLSYYKEIPYYQAENGNSGFFPNGRGWDVIPSVILGVGYSVPWKNGISGRIWCRPKVYWKIPFSQPSQPKFALQIGYSHLLGKAN